MNDFRLYETVWYTPDADVFGLYRAGGAYPVLFVEPDDESPELFAWIKDAGRGRFLVRHELLSCVVVDKYGNAILPERAR